MKNKKKNYGKGIKTRFLSSLEIGRYLTILGADRINNDVYALDGLICGVDREYQGIYIVDGLSSKQLKLFKKYGMEDSIYGYVILNLEGLVLLHTALSGQDIEENFANNLYEARKQLLLSVMNEKEKLTYDGEFIKFDEFVTPFLSDDFDIDEFLDKCVFNTTGYYEKDGYDKCLKFQWIVKNNPEISYDFSISGEGFHDIVSFKKTYERFFQQLCHYVGENKDKVKLYNGNGINAELDLRTNQICERLNFSDRQFRDATDFDKSKLFTIGMTFFDEKLSFKKEKELKKTNKKISNSFY